MRATDIDPGSARFSLFDSDGLHRLYAALHLGRYTRFRLLKRCALAILLTWVPVALLSLVGPYSDHEWGATKFFADFAAYAQFLIAMPLFVLAEPIVDASTRGAAKQFISCGITRPRDCSRLYGWNVQIASLRKSLWPDLSCLVIAYALSLVILVPEFGSNPHPTWHVTDYPVHFLSYTSIRTLTAAGAWEFLIALPVLNYTWLRFVWKILLWTYYQPPECATASHPPRSGWRHRLHQQHAGAFRAFHPGIRHQQYRGDGRLRNHSAPLRLFDNAGLGSRGGIHHRRSAVVYLAAVHVYQAALPQ